MHVFMVQLRDENHALLPGIEAGDVGAKLGDHAIDTGMLVRVLCICVHMLGCVCFVYVCICLGACALYMCGCAWVRVLCICVDVLGCVCL